jgi:hypothetical protein
MAVDLVDRLTVLVAVLRVPGMGVDDSCFYNYVRMQHFVCRTTYVHDQHFWGMCGENSCNVFSCSYGTLGSYLRDALHECSADVVACLLVHEHTEWHEEG